MGGDNEYLNYLQVAMILYITFFIVLNINKTIYTYPLWVYNIREWILKFGGGWILVDPLDFKSIVGW